jgi:hypothetical protein
MLSPYSPMAFTEALATERRIDPRILTAAGDTLPARRTLRTQFGHALVRAGRWLSGNATLPETASA